MLDENTRKLIYTQIKRTSSELVQCYEVSENIS